MSFHEIVSEFTRFELIYQSFFVNEFDIVDVDNFKRERIGTVVRKESKS